MTAREQEIYDEIVMQEAGVNHVDPVKLARLLARLEQPKPGAAGEQQALVWHLSGMRCGAFHNSKDFYIDSREHVTCPACLKLMRDGTGKEPAAPEPGKAQALIGFNHSGECIMVCDGHYMHWLHSADVTGALAAFKALRVVIDAERAAAAGEARRKALEEAIGAIRAVRANSRYGENLKVDVVLNILSGMLMLDAAAAPAGEGSKT